MAEPISPTTISPTFLKPTPTVGPQGKPAGLDEAAVRGRARKAAEDFEGQFLSIMVQQMFAGVETDGPFGGGVGEEMFRSLMTEAMGKQMTRAGGIGLADTVQREILKMQGLT